jgi:sugar O-acyltransferase (sialic acid O-acetyltransferase NeuD family)
VPRGLNELPREVVLFGGTGQAKLVRPIIEHHGAAVVAVFDRDATIPPPFPDVPLHQGLAGFDEWVRGRRLDELGFCVAIANPHGRVRLELHDQLVARGLEPVTIAHPTAHVAASATVGPGCQLLAGAIVSEEARLGRQCIIATNASVDHDCVLGDGVGLAPGATLCGLVQVDVNGWICAGATVLPRMRIGADSVVGAGAVVTRDVPAGLTVLGIPARPRARGEAT